MSRRNLQRISSLTLLILLIGAAPAFARVKIVKIYFNPSGPDNGSAASLNAEKIVLKNTSDKARQVGKWKLTDAGRDHRYLFFGGYAIPPNSTVTIHTGEGGDASPKHRYWNLEDYVWNNDGDTAKLYDQNWNLIDRCSYGRSAESPKSC